MTTNKLGSRFNFRWLFTFLAGATILLFEGSAQAQTVTWTRCASENGTCSFSGTRQVRYGANGSFVFRDATGSIACNNATFGDPAFGVVKFCDYSSVVQTPTTETWTRCATENGTCSFSGTRQVRYGANGSFAYRTATGSISCNNATFGDPAFGVAKSCDYSSVVQTPPTTTTVPTTTETWTRCATENGTCSFSGTRQVRYGANGSFAYRTATGSISCNNATFGDPIPGTVKACDYSSIVQTTPPTTTTMTPPPTTLPPPPPPTTTTTTTLPPGPVSAWPVLQTISASTRPLLPAAAEPAYLSWITDLGTTAPYTSSGTPVSEITRVSDASAFGLPGDSFFKISYSKVPAWNSDDSLLMLGLNGSSGFRAAILDGKTFRHVRNLRYAYSGGRWANANPRLYYVHNSNGTLAALDVTTDTLTTVRSFSAEGYNSNGGVGMGGGEGRQDNADRMFPLLLVNGSGQNDLVNYDRISNSIVGKIQMASRPGPGGVVDWWSASQSGKFIITGSTAAWTTRNGIAVPSGVNIWSPQGQLLRTLNARAGNHMDMALDPAGNDVVFFIAPKLGSNDKTGQTWRMDGSQGTATQTQFTDMVGWMYHISAANTNKPGWAIVTSMPASTPSNYNLFPMWNHTFAVKLDGSGKIAPMASLHHTNTSQTNNDYARQPFGCPNRSLTAVVWGGTWGDHDNAGPIHSYVARPKSP